MSISRIRNFLGHSRGCGNGGDRRETATREAAGERASGRAGERGREAPAYCETREVSGS